MKKTFTVIEYLVIVSCLALAAVEFYPALSWMLMRKHLFLYKWVGVGIGAYFLLRLLPPLKKNEPFLQTFSHELTHTIVGMMFGHKIHSLEATSEEGGVMSHSGGRFGGIFISLAPYCFPIFTYAFLLLRIIGAWKLLMWFDIFIGFTLAFHIVCFAKQTRLYQTDIQGQGYVRSSFFIITFWLFNATIVLLSIRKGIVNTVLYLFPLYWKDIVGFWNWVF